jgi:hypothetical protein
MGRPTRALGGPCRADSSEQVMGGRPAMVEWHGTVGQAPRMPVGTPRASAPWRAVEGRAPSGPDRRLMVPQMNGYMRYSPESFAPVERGRGGSAPGQGTSFRRSTSRDRLRRPPRVRRDASRACARRHRPYDGNVSPARPAAAGSDAPARRQQLHPAPRRKRAGPRGTPVAAEGGIAVETMPGSRR